MNTNETAHTPTTVFGDARPDPVPSVSLRRAPSRLPHARRGTASDRVGGAPLLPDLEGLGRGPAGRTARPRRPIGRRVLTPPSRRRRRRRQRRRRRGARLPGTSRGERKLRQRRGPRRGGARRRRTGGTNGPRVRIPARNADANADGASREASPRASHDGADGERRGPSASRRAVTGGRAGGRRPRLRKSRGEPEGARPTDREREEPGTEDGRHRGEPVEPERRMRPDAARVGAVRRARDVRPRHAAVRVRLGVERELGLRRVPGVPAERGGHVRAVGAELRGDRVDAVEDVGGRHHAVRDVLRGAKDAEEHDAVAEQGAAHLRLLLRRVPAAARGAVHRQVREPQHPDRVRGAPDRVLLHQQVRALPCEHELAGSGAGHRAQDRTAVPPHRQGQLRVQRVGVPAQHAGRRAAVDHVRVAAVPGAVLAVQPHVVVLCAPSHGAARAGGGRAPHLPARGVRAEPRRRHRQRRQERAHQGEDRRVPNDHLLRRLRAGHAPGRHGRHALPHEQDRVLHPHHVAGNVRRSVGRSVGGGGSRTD